MIRNFVFDMGNVLLSWNPDYIVSQCIEDPETRVAVRDALFLNPDWAMIDAGKLSEEEMYGHIQPLLPEHMHAALKKTLEVFDAYAPAFPHVQGMMEYLKAQGYHLYILSNAGARFRSRLEKQTFYPLLDGILISAEDKIMKPDVRIYELLCSRFGLVPGESVFIDDIEANILGAHAAGLHGIQYKGDPDALRKEIERLLAET